MGNWLISAVGGSLLIVSGLLMMRSHHRTWQQRKSDPEMPDNDRWHYRHQHRRRMQASGIFVVLGLLIPLADYDPLFRDHPLLWTALILVILMLTLWVGLLAAGDLMSTRAYSRRALGRIYEKQRQLERELLEIEARTSDSRRDA